MKVLTPREIVTELNKHIIGQDDAKRAVAIALRNRWRRMQLEEEMRQEVTPKNILMIGPTGVGKTEIARRLARLAHAPFIKVEATKFTEVGYIGRDVESIVRDLTDLTYKSLTEEALNNVRAEADEAAEERIIDALLPAERNAAQEDGNSFSPETRQHMRKFFREGRFDDREIEIETSFADVGVELVGPPGMEEMTDHLREVFSNFRNDKTKTTRIKVSDAKRKLSDEEAMKLINDEELKMNALSSVEESGIVFLDEIDKVAKRATQGVDVSREGVQRDLLPLIEGCTVSTRYGMVRTDHILFIASGAFHFSKPSDLIPELQGRLPIRVELKALTPEDFKRILTEPDASLTEQYQELLKTDDIELSFTEDALERIAELACQVNDNTENIGARRLHTILEKLMEDVSFTAGEEELELTIDASYVDDHLAELAKDQDLSRYIL